MKAETECGSVRATESYTVIPTIVLVFVLACGAAPASHAGGVDGGGGGVQYSVMIDKNLALVQPGAGDTGTEQAFLFQRDATGGGWVLSDPDGAGTDGNMRFSYSAAVSGELAVVGAPWRDGFKGGAVVLRKTGGRWIVEQQLTPRDPGRYDHFGGSVAIRGDAILVGAPWHDMLHGAVYVFRRMNGVWRESEALTMADRLPEQVVGDLVTVSDNAIVIRDGGGDAFTEEDVRASGVIAAIALVDKGGEGPPLLPTAVPPAPASLMATDAALEDRVELTWTGVDMDAIVYKILRDGQPLTVVSSDETQWSDLTGELGVTYEYCVLVKDMADQESTPTCDNGSRVIFAPMNVSATDGEYTDGVWITWIDLSSINTGYSIRRGGMALGSAGPNATSFQDTTGVASTMYSYDVIATVDGYESAPGSDTGWRATILPPRDVVASDGQYPDRVRITWVGQEPAAQAYRIYRDGSLIDSTAATVTTYDDTLAAFGYTYTYCVATKVAAVTGIGKPGLRPAATGGDESIRVCDPGGIGLIAPANVSASDSTYDDRIRITWEDRSDFEDGFEIRRAAFGDSVVLDTVGVGVTSYNDYAAGPDTTYTYLVRAVNDLGGVSPHSSDTGYRAIVLAPTAVAASDGTFEDHVDITWKSASTTAVLFKIYRNGAMIKSVGRGDRQYRDYGGTAGEIYDYGVAAVTALEDEALGAVDAGKRELLAPSSVSASDEEFEEKVVISWTDHSLFENGYEVSRHDTAGLEPDTTFVLGQNSTSMTDYCGAPGVTYSYSVAAYDNASGELGRSEPGVDLGRRILLAPTGVRADKGVSETEIEIIWRDNSDAEDGYHIYRDSLLIGATEDNHTHFVDLSPTLGDIHTYRVSAHDSYGESEGGEDSGYTSILAPASVNASDEYSGGVEITWLDQSKVEQGYRVYRNNEPLVTLPENSTHFTDVYAAPGIIGTFKTPSAVEVFVSGQYAYVADNTSGLYIFDISDPAHPDSIGIYETFDQANAVHVSGGYAYITQGYSGYLQIIDVSDPANPSPLGSIPTPEPSDVYVSGDYAYVAAGIFGLWVIDISNPLSPLGAGFYDTPGSASGVYVSGNYAYVADGDSGLIVVDVSDPMMPTGVATHDTPGSARDVFIAGTYAYVTDTIAGLRVIDISAPTDPIWLSDYDTPGDAHGVFVSGDYAYVADFDHGLQVVDVSVPTQVVAADHLALPAEAFGVFVSGDHAYVADSEEGLQILRTGEVSGAVASGTPYSYCVQSYNGESVSEEACDLGSVPVASLSQVSERLQKILASGGTGNDDFGSSVAVSGNLALIGAPGPSMDTGSAYIFRRNDDDDWIQETKLLASDGAADDQFGSFVAIDGAFALVGAWRTDDDGLADSGSAYIFRRDASGSWVQVAKLRDGSPGAGDRFGGGVALSGDLALVGSSGDDDYGSGSGSVFVFRRRTDGSWTEEAKLSPTDAAAGKYFGRGVAINGDVALVGAFGDRDNGYSSGSAYAFRRDGNGIWTQEAKLLANDGADGDQFGGCVSICGDLAVVGALYEDSNGPNAGAAYTFRHTGGGVWVEESKLTALHSLPGDRFGSDVSISGDQVVVGMSPAYGITSGSAYLFQRQPGGRWRHKATLVPVDSALDDYFGSGVAIDEDVVLVGAFDVSAAYTLHMAPSVSASDGTYPGRISVSWADEFATETGFRIYRNGMFRDQVPANVKIYDDVADPIPGRAYAYSVTALVDSLEMNLGSDMGWRPTDGEIRGRVATREGGGVEGVHVSLEPPGTRSLLFDGKDGSASVADDGTLDFDAAAPYTVESWIRYAGNGGSKGDHGTVLGKVEASTRYPFLLRNDRGNGAAGRLVFAVSDGATQLSIASKRDDLNDDSWVHVACVHDTTQNQLRLYINGALDSTVTYTSLGDITNSDDLVLGASGFGSFEGQIDEVRVWDVARSSEEIASSITTPLVGNEPDLVGYWPFDEDGDEAAVGRVSGSSYCLLSGGVYRSEDVAPVDVSAVTGSDGSFSLTGIPYGDYQVRPWDGDRQFQPPVTGVALNSGSPVQNLVNFVDISSFTVSGTIRYASTGCPAPDVLILVDSRAAGATDSKGKFAIAADLGEHWIRPDRVGHVFGPDSLLVDARRDTVINDSTGVAFVDSTTHMLSGRLGGGCGRPVGAITVTIRSENDCLLETLEFSPSDTVYSVALPPQNYLVSAFVDPLSIPGDLSKTDVVSYFQNLGVRLAEMDSLDATMDFVYRAPLRVSIKGFDSYVETCPGPLTFGQRVLPDGLPVIPQLTILPLTIEVAEDYGSGGLCPLDSGTVVIYDEIFDRQNAPFELSVFNGVAVCTTFASTPSLVVGRVDERGTDRSFQKAITAVVEVEGRANVTATEWVLVTGHVAPQGADFVTATTQMPLYILRDPPGDKSLASLQRGSTIRTRVDWEREVWNAGGGFLSSISTGWKITTFYGIGAGAINHVEVMTPFQTDQFFGNMYFREESTDITVTTRSGFATSSNEAFVGAEGDVFVGAGVNFVFAEVGVIAVDDCAVTKSTAVSFEPDSVKTVYAYTQRYISDVLIPELDSKVEYYTNTVSADEDSALMFTLIRDDWDGLLAMNDSLKAAATTTENRTFSAGADYTYLSSHDTTKSYRSTNTFVWDSSYRQGLPTVDLPWVDIAFSIVAKIHHERLDNPGDAWDDDRDTTGTGGMTVGYTLGDDDIGDHFTVDIKDDQRYPSPVFDVRAGVSSCPYEPWPDTTGAARMMPRDKPQLFVSPIRRDAVPPDEAASFTLTLANQSPTEESRLYVLRLLNTSNPDGAIVRVGGVPLSNGLSYEIDPEQSQRATLTVERGPTAYQYENLDLVLYSPCEVTDLPYPRPSGSREQSSALADTFSFSVTFDAPCSDVTLTLPEPGWTFTQADQDTGGSVVMLLSDYEFHVSEDDSIQSVWGQYRRLGVGREGPSEWVSIAAESLGTTETLIAWSPPETLEDGVYELRAYTQCAGGKAYSGTVTGTIERHGPQVLGTPEPADGELSFGEDISITFNELIDCRSVTADSVILTYLDGPSEGLDIPLETVCDEATIVITPTADPADLEGRRLEARVAGVTDKAGNPMVQAVTWEFEVRRSRFTWNRLHLNADVPYRDPGSITADLVNGTGRPVTFSITDVPAWVTMANPGAGTIPASEKQTVTLTLEDTLSIGQYEGEVRAAADDTTQGVAVFDLVVTVSCHEPEWVVDPSDFEHTMTMVAELDIDGEISTDPDDRVAAFVGNQLRGVASLQEVPVGTPPYPYLAFLTVYSNRLQDETVRFQVWDADSCRHYDTTLESYPFVANGSIGSTGAPVTLTAAEGDGGGALTIAVNPGWTWISTNRTSADMSVNAVLSDLTPVPGDLIKSQAAFSQFVADSTGWSGGLTSLDNRSCYMVRLTEPGAIVHDGTWANVPVPVQQGWNWVGYLPQGPIDVSSALMNLGGLATVGDVIKSQSGFAEYTGGGWYGSLQVMEPGSGYKLHLGSGVITSFTYPVYVPPPEAPGFLAGTGGSEALDFGTPATGLDDGMPLWSVDPHAYEHTMTVTAVLNITGSESTDGRDRVAAFVGDACRGVTGPIRVDGVGRHEIFLMVHSNKVAGEQVVLRAFDAGTGLVYEIDETMAFEADEILGEVQNPLVLNARSVWGGGKAPQVFSLAQNRPNPFSMSTGIAYDVPSDGSHVTIRIYDVMGRLVRTLVDRVEAQGKQEVTWDRLSDRGRPVRAGVYFYRMIAPGFDKARRMIVVR